MARSKYKKSKKLNTRTSFTDTLFIDQKIRGCEAQLIKIENKLVKLKSKTGLMKLVVMKDIEQLTRNYHDYEKFLKHLKAAKAQKMNRVALYQDAFEDIRESFSRFCDNLNISKKEEVMQDENINLTKAQEERICEIKEELFADGIQDYDALIKRCAKEGIVLT